MAIKFDKRNYRKHNDRNKDLINKSLKECGAGRSIVIDNEENIIAGNGIYEQAKKLGIKTKVIETDGSELVVVKRTDLATDDAKRKQLAVMDNSTSDSSEWDFEKLETDFDAEELQDWGIDADIEIEETENEVIEVEVPDEVETRCKLGDIWQLGEHRLMCGDSTKVDDVEKLMNGEKADMVFTDPPYNLNYEGGSKKREKIKNDKVSNFYQFLLDCFNNCYKYMINGGNIYICHSELERENITSVFNKIGFTASSVIIWAKNNSTFSMNKDYKQKHEPILYGWKGTGHIWNGGNCEDTIWEIARPTKSDLHPTMKPIELCARAIKNSSNLGSLLYEPFGGSGSTLIACEQLNRKCYMMELDEKYCSVILQRYINFKGNSEDVYLLNNDGTKTKYEDLINEKR